MSLFLRVLRNPVRAVRRLQELAFAYAGLREEVGLLQAQVTNLYLDESPPENYQTQFEMAPGVLSDNLPALDAYLKEPRADAGEPERLYHAMQLVLRGSQALISDRQRIYLPAIREHASEAPAGPILDVGCGRGEFLGILREAGIAALGVDTSASEVASLVSRGFEAHCADALDYLRSVPDAHLSGVTAFQVIEHFEHDYLREFLKLAGLKLAPGGFILLETVNPYCLDTFRTYYLDPTHKAPVPIDLLAILLKFYGYTGLRAFYQHPVPVRKVNSMPDPRRYYENYALWGLKPGASA